ncbi:hypothetical protein [Candidatus Burkholderia verschuerenii]|uniref:hypothetical protein n=1 Tax=Candidatus Burkholderia verschuerenii TaxID=242163 RepID=UPI000B004CF7|nr:hypothetical protein [Candidatus Burkholderia verschuerenii]
MKDTKAKLRLAERAFPLMTAARINARDPEGEVRGWMQRIRDMLGGRRVKTGVSEQPM